MKYIVDIIDTITDEEFKVWATAGNHSIVHEFNHFDKTYLIETDNEIVAGGIVESVVVDDHTTALKLLSTPTYTLDTTNDDNWWKSIIIIGALDSVSPEILRQGEGYAVYLMDSGVDDSHIEFADTKIRHLFSHTSTNADLNGHGTALASIISGKTAGVTSAEIVSVKIFEGGTPTLISDLLRALDMVVVDYIQNYPTKPAVVNMSWGINKNEYVESKIRAMIDLGLVFVAAAGNSGIPIGDVTPEGMAEVLTIGSINTDLSPSNFSNYTGTSSISVTANETNYAPGLDYSAPGEYILAANKDGGFNHIAGTSVAAAIFSASAIYSMARLSIEFDNEYQTSGVLTDILEGNHTTAVTRISFRDEIRIASGNNLFLFSRALVVLPEKYKLCTNRVPVTPGIKEPTLESAEYYRALNQKPLTPSEVFVNTDKPIRALIVRPGHADSCSFSSLPNGLSVEGNYLVGTINEDLAGERFKVYDTVLTIVSGTDSLDVNFQIVHFDPSLLSKDFSSADYEKEMLDSNLTLMYGVCTGCRGQTSACGGSNQCLACTPCAPDFKTTGEVCVFYYCRV